MRALLVKYVGAGQLAPRLLELWRAALVLPLAFLEIFFATALFDFYVPAYFPVWQNPVFYTNALGKIALVGAFLFVLVAWPRRKEVEARYIAAGSEGVRTALAANAVLFTALMVCRYHLATATAFNPGLLYLYSALFLATAASTVLALAPAAFWRALVKAVPAELLVTLFGAAVVVIAGALAREGWESLSGATLTLSHWYLTLYEPSVFLDAPKRILGVGDFKVQVFAECSGYEGVAMIVAFLSAYMWVFRRDLRFPNVLLLLPIGVAVIWSLNALRISVLVSIGAHFSPEVAIQGFHSTAGWISFLLVTLGCILISRRIPFFVAAQGLAPASGAIAAVRQPPRPVVVFLMPFVALLATSILASAFAPHDQWLYPVKAAAIAGVLWWFRDSYLHLFQGASLSSVAVGLGVGVAWIVTDPGKGAESALGVWLASLPLWAAALWLTIRAMGSVVLVPVAEELAFRGYLARVLVAKKFEDVSFGDFRWLAFVGSSLAFGMVHQRWLAAFLAGAIYALLMYRTKKLSDPIAAHAASNAALVFWAIAAEQWSLL